MCNCVTALVITNGPMDTTVCNGSVASISCGFVNDSVTLYHTGGLLEGVMMVVLSVL